MTDLPVDTDMDALPSTMFDRVIRALDVAYYEWTVGSEKIHVSPALADMFGFGPDTWTVERQTELLHPDDRPGPHPRDRQAPQCAAGVHRAPH